VHKCQANRKAWVDLHGKDDVASMIDDGFTDLCGKTLRGLIHYVPSHAYQSAIIFNKYHMLPKDMVSEHTWNL